MIFSKHSNFANCQIEPNTTYLLENVLEKWEIYFGGNLTHKAVLMSETFTGSLHKENCHRQTNSESHANKIKSIPGQTRVIQLK